MASLPGSLGSTVLRNRTLKRYVAVAAERGPIGAGPNDAASAAQLVAAASGAPLPATARQVVSEVEGGDEEVERLAAELFGIHFDGACPGLLNEGGSTLTG